MNCRVYSCQILGISLLLWAVAGVSSRAGAQQSRKLHDLRGVVPSVELESGSEAIGGASIEDAVALLRHWTAFPICFESRALSRETDGLTLAEALIKLH